VSLSEIPNLMRALGFYPSQKQIARMTGEVQLNSTSALRGGGGGGGGGGGRSSRTSPTSAAAAAVAAGGGGGDDDDDDDDSKAKDIGLHEFVRLYINHRPVFGVSNADIEAAFETLGARSEDGGKLAWAELKYRLQHEGEAISDAELKAIMGALRGGDEPPARMNADTFASEVLGFAGDQLS
jgi:Ca2+-binding EF-hand superfamily protein